MKADGATAEKRLWWCGWLSAAVILTVPVLFYLLVFGASREASSSEAVAFRAARTYLLKTNVRIKKVSRFSKDLVTTPTMDDYSRLPEGSRILAEYKVSLPAEGVNAHNAPTRFIFEAFVDVGYTEGVQKAEVILMRTAFEQP